MTKNAPEGGQRSSGSNPSARLLLAPQSPKQLDRRAAVRRSQCEKGVARPHESVALARDFASTRVSDQKGVFALEKGVFVSGKGGAFAADPP